MHLPDEVYLYIFLLLYGAGTACHSEAPEFTPGFIGVHIVLSVFSV
jgi:hypothetical protein